MNRVILIGRLSKDPDCRTTPNGRPVADFPIEVPRPVKSLDPKVPDRDYFRVRVSGAAAAWVGSHMARGRMVSVEGRIEMREFTDESGKIREAAEIVAENIVGLDRPRDQQAPAEPSSPRRRKNAA